MGTVITSENCPSSHGTLGRKIPHGARSNGLREGTIGADRSIGELGEFGLIARMASRTRPGPGTIVGIGDDAAVLAAPDGRVVATTDFLLEGRHFRVDWSGPGDIGHRAAVRSLADVAAMGAVPTALLVAFAAPPELAAQWALDVFTGLAAEAERAGATVAGGDTAQAGSVLLAVTGLGDLQGRAPVRRSGARPGDVVAVAGPLGRSAAGLALLEAGVGEPAEVIGAHLRPSPPYDAGPEAAGLGATAMIDVSDGLLADLGHVADASGVLIDVQAGWLDTGPLEAAAAVLAEKDLSHRTDSGVRPSALAWALTGGEDHSLVAAFPAELALPSRWAVIGAVREGHGVVVDGQPYAGAPGWQHFR
jgi:thiamine-monophosphate kinase